MRVPAVAVITAVITAVVTAVVTAVAALTVSASPAAAADGPAYYWRWSDGSSATARTLGEARLDGRPPALVVDTHPATSGRRIVLQFRDHGHWRIEDAGVTRADGSVRLELNPFCEDGAWCTGSYGYRLLAGGRTASLTVAFAP
jgi:hypothetical protein